MIRINRMKIAHTPSTKTYELMLDFVTPEGKFAYLAHLNGYQFNTAKNEKLFLKRNCSSDYSYSWNIENDEIFPDDLVLKNYKESIVSNNMLFLEFEKEEDDIPPNYIGATVRAIREDLGAPVCAIGDARIIFNITILNIWVNKKKDIVVVELARKGVTKKIKVHKEKGVKFDVYNAVCAAMAIFEYGSNSALKREIERKVHYVESK